MLITTRSHRLEESRIAAVLTRRGDVREPALSLSAASHSTSVLVSTDLTAMIAVTGVLCALFVFVFLAGRDATLLNPVSAVQGAQRDLSASLRIPPKPAAIFNEENAPAPLQAEFRLRRRKPFQAVGPLSLRVVRISPRSGGSVIETRGIGHDVHRLPLTLGRASSLQGLNGEDVTLTLTAVDRNSISGALSWSAQSQPPSQ